MDFLKRIGTDRHKFKVQFFLKKLSCNTKKLKGDVYIKIKRGDHKVNSEKKVSLQDDGTCDFGREILTFQSLTMFYDSDKKAYQEKQGEISIIIVTNKGKKKLLGSFQFDVAEYANSGKENIQVKKQFGDKVKAVLQFDVFIKCLGEASQTNKSVDKPILDRKKQSSLSKFTSFFVGNKNDDEKQKDEEDQDQQEDRKNKVKRKERVTSNSKNQARESSKQKLDNFKYYSNVVKRNDATASDKKIAEKQRQKQRLQQQRNKKKQKQPSNSQQGSQAEEQTPEKPPKNLVNIKKKDNFTELEYSEQLNNKTNPKKKGSAPQQEEEIYFDQPASYAKKKNDRVSDEPEPEHFKSNKIKRTQNAGYNNTNNKEEKQQRQNGSNKKINQFNLKIDKNIKADKTDKADRIQKIDKPERQSKKYDKISKPQKPSLQQTTAQLQNSLSNLQQQNTTLKKQNKQLKAQNQKLSQQNKTLNKKLLDQEKEKNRSNQDFYNTQRQGNNKKADDERVRILEKQKGDLLVKVQKLQQKYKKDFQKYQQSLQHSQQQNQQLQQTSKAEIKRLKQQFSQLRQKYDKLMSKYEQKIAESKQYKQKQNDIKERLAIAQNSLSELKLKIGDKLNQANQDGNRSVIDVLMLLSQ